MAKKRIQVMKTTLKANFPVSLTHPESIAEATQAFADLKKQAAALGFVIEADTASFGSAEVDA